MADQKILLGNVRGEQGPAGPNTVSSIYEWSSSGISGAPDLSTSAKMAEHFGGTWQEFGKGQVLVGLDAGQTEFATVGKTGGEINHTLTIAEMPQHSHEMKWSNEGAVGSGHGCLIRDNLSGESWPYGYWTGQDGGVQPYITVFRYRRVA